ncbi:hypothetical protein [Paenibacillus sp. MER TA 81-3]|uniref:hypothetical protein n=1 Tax=Paenibacillus sp. MER TA 81-3 TaxID=2939573 RepID=UPI00203ACF10|nr:hypothetical protein [Paenibacillus sp. MER TA 81-3]
MKERVIELYTAKYYGSNCCHFAELLEEHESLTLSASSVRRILLTSGLKQAKQRRRSKAHPPRERKPQAGMLWQIDATPYAWLEDRAPSFTLHAAIDDATRYGCRCRLSSERMPGGLFPCHAARDRKIRDSPWALQ